MKRISLTLFCLAVVSLVICETASAGLFGRRGCGLFGRARGSCGSSYASYAATPYQSVPYQKSTPTQKGDTPTQKGDLESPQVINNYYGGGPLFRIAQRRAAQLARQRRGGHYWQIGPGFSAEGWGYGSTPQAALNACCTFSRGVAGYAAVSDGAGGYYAIKLYY